jgi:hypothetical protein
VRHLPARGHSAVLCFPKEPLASQPEQVQAICAHPPSTHRFLPQSRKRRFEGVPRTRTLKLEEAIYIGKTVRWGDRFESMWRAYSCVRFDSSLFRKRTHDFLFHVGLGGTGMLHNPSLWKTVLSRNLRLVNGRFSNRSILRGS